MARPGIAAGVLLAVMETIADYGTVAHLQRPDLLDRHLPGLVRDAGPGGGGAARALPARLRAAAGGGSSASSAARRSPTCAAARGSAAAPRPLAGWRGARGDAALPRCRSTIGFLLPAAVLATMAAGRGRASPTRATCGFVGNSLTLAGGGGGGHGGRGGRRRLPRAGCARARTSRALVLGAGLGYAVPGGVIAVGLLVPFAGLDNLIDAWARAQLGVSTGLVFTGTIGLLVLAYMARFMAVALNAFDAGLATVSPRIDAVARTLGRGPVAVLGAVHLPIVKGSLLSARADRLRRHDEGAAGDADHAAVRLRHAGGAGAPAGLGRAAGAAAVPSLVIAAIGLLPVILICRAIAGERRAAAGARGTAGRVAPRSRTRATPVKPLIEHDLPGAVNRSGNLG